LYTSSDTVQVKKSRITRWSGHMECTGENRNAYRVWLENLNRPLGRPRQRWENNIKIIKKYDGRA
jgi:hypothetical protein